MNVIRRTRVKPWPLVPGPDEVPITPVRFVDREKLLKLFGGAVKMRQAKEKSKAASSSE